MSKNQREILVIATIHQNHQTNPNYSYQDLVNILDAFNPDAICVEILPAMFRKQAYLPEMMLGSVYGFENGKKVCPIDYWGDRNPREERAAYVQTEEYKLKAKEEKEALKNSAIIQDFEKKYGSIDELFKANKMGYEFFNGKEYNDYTRENYEIQIKTYGDSCINLYSNKRNEEMLKLMENSLDDETKKILILAGAEHKYYFDDALKKREGFKLIELGDILPLKEAKMTKNVAGFIEKGLAFGYYDETVGSDAVYNGALMPLIHGMNMDFTPEIIPAANIEKAKEILLEWEKESSDSAFLQFEKAWVAFLSGEYQEAIDYYLKVAEQLEVVTASNMMIKPVFWRNLGWNYDLVGQREKAIEAYRKCKDICVEMGIDKEYGPYIYKDYQEKPYRAEK